MTVLPIPGADTVSYIGSNGLRQESGFSVVVSDTEGALPPFLPGVTANIAATTDSSSVALPAGSSGAQVRIASQADNALAFIRFGASNVVAAITDMPLLPGTVEVFSVPAGATHLAVITGATTATLYVTAGEGA